MKKVFTLIAFAAICFFGNYAFGQARIISTGGPFMVMDAGASGAGVYLVVENGNADALSPSSGAPDLNLVSEDENNIVKWFLGPTLSTGTNYQIPFSDVAGDYTRSILLFPNAASTGALNPNFYMEFSTYGTPSTNLPLPTEVNHLTNLNVAVATPGVQGNNANNLNTVDRYWFIEMFNFTTQPQPQLRFSLAPGEYGAPNSISTSNVMLQRFNPGAGTMGQWADWFSAPTTINGLNTTTNVTVPAGEFYKTWTLTSFDEPLSVELLDLQASCENERALIKWSTATEQNSDYFTVESSTDGQYWETVQEVDAAGNSSSIINYSVYDENAKSGINYYRVTETDINGIESTFEPVSASCGSNAFEIVNVLNDYNTNGELDIIVNTSEDKMTDIRIIDMAGKLVYERPNQLIQEGVSTITLNKGDLAMGVYFIAIQSSDEVLTRKVVLN